MSDPDGPLIMGILNVTPDSFSDGGSYRKTADAVAHAIRMIAEGADIIDIGGESTRPGAQRIPAAVQIERVLPVISELRDKMPDSVVISIDTTLAAVAAAAIDAGAAMINDVSAGRDDDDMFSLAAEKDVKIVLMHMQGTPGTMQDNPTYSDVVEQIYYFLLGRADLAVKAGVSKDKIVIDPGIGFGKTLSHNIEIINNLHRYVQSGYPVLLGASRKRFLKTICNTEKPASLAGATSAITAYGVFAGVKIFRVHDILENRQTSDVIYYIKHSKTNVSNQ